uniref:Uncharacterized protein n=1 Tax=Caenorhabditis tropicalis TaxID=1561998 RepID=A0A1I7TYR2_9PELO
MFPTDLVDRLRLGRTTEDRDERFNYITYGNLISAETDDEKLEWLKRKVNSQQSVIVENVLSDIFTYIRDEDFLKNIENKKRFSSEGVGYQKKQKKVIPEKSEVPSSSMEEKHEEIGTTEKEKPETSVKKQVETPKKKKTMFNLRRTV